MRNPFPASKIWAAIEDWLIPALRLNTHERALYYHLVRRTHLDSRRTVRVSRSILARVSGLSPCIARHYLRSLARKQCVLILDRRPQGCLVEVRLPNQIRRALARLPRRAAAQLLWPSGQLERTAAGHPRAWPRPHPLVAPNFRAAILHRNSSTFQHFNLSTLQPFNVHPSTSSSLSTSRPSTLRHFDPSTFRPSSTPRCFYCHAPLRPRQWSLDHIVPRTLGGSDSPSNLVAACHSCNSQKAASPADLFLRTLFRRRLISRRHLQLRLKAIHSL